MGVRLEGTGGSLRLSDVTGDLRWKDWEHSQTVKKKKNLPLTQINIFSLLQKMKY